MADAASAKAVLSYVNMAAPADPGPGYGLPPANTGSWVLDRLKAHKAENGTSDSEGDNGEPVRHRRSL